ncbi:MAG TPA: DUF2807 domain-containing protein, partial [Gammaproteobacteria bacterium]|nr:DUF2807 domain-containing protein [Gammaproteobacteria bacterium]
MKKLVLLGITLLVLSLLTSCSYNASSFSQLKPNEDLQKEHWVERVNASPQTWLGPSTSWFLTGEANPVEQSIATAPSSKAMTQMAVKVLNFDTIHVNGNFQVQIVAGEPNSSLVIVGPNEQVRRTATRISNGALYISQPGDTRNRLNNIIVRISVRQLRALYNSNNADIFGRNIVSDRLMINSAGNGNILLADVYTPSLTITT